jgi:hypothetical protein
VCATQGQSFRRACGAPRGATELASEFLNCKEKLAHSQLVIFYFKFSKNRTLTVVSLLVRPSFTLLYFT